MQRTKSLTQWRDKIVSYNAFPTIADRVNSKEVAGRVLFLLFMYRCSEEGTTASANDEDFLATVTAELKTDFAS